MVKIGSVTDRLLYLYELHFIFFPLVLFCFSFSKAFKQQKHAHCIIYLFLFYISLGLQLHSQKTKVLIFNKAGKLIKGHTFLLDGVQLEVTDSYQYLGIKI